MTDRQNSSTNAGIPEYGELPRHVAIIMDGNGRWARKKGLPRIAGHRKGVDIVREIVAVCGEKGIPYLTLFAFSSENWRRPKKEVQLLLELFVTALKKEIKKLHKNNVRFQAIGDVHAFNKKITNIINEAETLTKNNTGLMLTIAFNYGGRWDIAQATAEVARRVKAGEIDSESITEDTLLPYLSLAGFPDPDLFIRSGGEKRISNFLLWQLAYSELYFTNTLWPDFDRQVFDDSLIFYASRQRRFGFTGDQIETTRHA
ncbi:MAG: polyprenyl diphosphate synthase [Gammaproteobacteria bacterium]|nr:MAG: polyprenyl diphosphate synthase [Gammaproteobacteria bacterium]